MILHDFPPRTCSVAGNTLANPSSLDGQQLRTYDYVVANPPFSDKAWSTGITPETTPISALPGASRHQKATTPTCCTSFVA